MTRRQRLMILVMGALLTLPLAAAQKDQSAQAQLQAAINKETVERDLKGAIELYKKIADGGDKAIAAKALLRLAGCYQKLGDQQASKVYERLVRDFGNQPEAAEARTRLAALGSAALAGTFTPREVCHDCGFDGSSLSTDGRVMAVTDWDTGDLAIRDMSTGRVKRLLAKAGNYKASGDIAYSPVLSPDERQVAYFWATAGEKTHLRQLRVMPNEPGGQPRVLFDHPGDGWLLPSAWSLDAKSVLVLVQKEDQTWQLAWVSAADGRINVLQSLDWRFRSDDRASLSPDGRYIAYSALATNPSKAPTRSAPPELTDRHIYVLAADGSSVTELIKTAGVNKDPVWTPDGAHVLFLSDRSGNIDLWSAPVRDGKAAGAPSRVKEGIGEKVNPIGMTPSGSFYYVAPSSSEVVDAVAIVEVPDRTKVPGAAVRASENVVGINPTWSPDGKFIAFTRHSTQRANNFDLVLHSLETGEEKAYRRDGLRQFAPIWFHDGSGVLMPLMSQPELNVPLSLATSAPMSWWFADLKSGTLKEVLPAASSPNVAGPSAALSPDDTTLYFVTSNAIGISVMVDTADHAVVAVNLKTREQRRVYAAPGPADSLNRLFALSPDGRTLAVEILDRNTKAWRVARVAIDGSDYRDLYSVPPSDFAGWLAWTKDGRAIVLATSTKSSANTIALTRIPVEGSTPATMGVALHNSYGFSFSLSPDDSRVVYSTTSGGNARSLWALDNLPAFLKGPR